MAKLDGVNIDKSEGGLQRLADNTDDHFAMLYPGITGSVAETINNSGKGVVIKSIYAAEQLGINESFDANNDTNLYRQILDFFRLSPESTLYLFNSDESEELTAFVNKNKEIKGYGVVLDLDLDTDLSAMISKHQVIINSLAQENRLIDFALIGINGLDDFTLDLHEQEAPNVSVVIGCEFADGKVAVGTALGSLAVRKVSENLGSVDIEIKPRSKRGQADYTLTDSLLSYWIEAYLTTGENIESVNKSVLKDIIEKGYIVVAGYEGYAGYFFENSYTCTDLASDYAFIENNRVWNKSARIIRATLLPRVKSKVKKDITTGYIASTTAGYWQSLIEKALTSMVVSDDISGFEVIIDHKQIVNSTQPVRVQANVVADGIVHEFEVLLGLTNNI